VVNVTSEQSFLQQQMTLLESRIAKEPQESPQRAILSTPRRPAGQGSVGGSIERMVGVTSVNLGGIEVDVEDVADRLRRLKVLSPARYGYYCSRMLMLGARTNACKWRVNTRRPRSSISLSICRFRFRRPDCFPATLTYNNSAVFNAANTKSSCISDRPCSSSGW